MRNPCGSVDILLRPAFAPCSGSSSRTCHSERNVPAAFLSHRSCPLTVCGPGRAVEESLFGVAKERMSTELIYVRIHITFTAIYEVRSRDSAEDCPYFGQPHARRPAFSLSFELPEFNIRRAGMLAAWNLHGSCFKVGSSRIPPPGAQRLMARSYVPLTACQSILSVTPYYRL
jgi:hypothetical protein